MTAEEFRKRLADLGLSLDEKAFQAALAGAQHLRAESEKLAQWLKP